MQYVHSIHPNAHRRLGMHAGGVARDVDFSRPLFRASRCGAATRRFRRCGEIHIATTAFCDIVFVVVVVIVNGYFENSFRC